MSSCFLTFNPSNPSSYDKICYDTSLSSVTNFSQKVGSTDSITFFSDISNSFDIDAVWVLLTAVLVFCMQIGFAFAQSSYIEPNQIKHTLFKNLIALCICGIVFYVVGQSMAFGANNNSYSDFNRFMGVENILIENKSFKSWFFEFMYLAVASTIVSGSISQRTSKAAYFIFTVFFSAWIYPVIVYWCWSNQGWLSPYSGTPRPHGGLMDFAGSGVVHMVGGFSGFIGALFLRARPNRFANDEKSKDQQRKCIYGHNVSSQVFGILFLWFGWYGFNCGRTLGATSVMQVASKIAVTTTLSAATSALSVATIGRIAEGYWEVTRICDGILCGLVAISSPCNVVDCGYAILIGFLAAIVYFFSLWLLQLFQIDDPMNSFSIHGMVGSFGLLAAGLFANGESLTFGYAGFNVPHLIEATKGHRFGTQVLGVVVISWWSIVNCIIIFTVMYRFLKENVNNVDETGRNQIEMPTVQTNNDFVE